MMTDTQIEQANEVIARFDGWEFIKGDPTIICGSCDLGKQPSMYCVCANKVDRFLKDGYKRYHHELKYHSDWNQLVSIYEKISRIWVNLSRPKQKAHEQIYRAIQNRILLPEIVSAHALIAEFIMLYNTLNKQQ